MRKQKSKMIVLPGLIWDNERWVPISHYSHFVCYTDKILGEILGVSQGIVGQWRHNGIIPCEMEGSFAKYNVNDCIAALLKNGYTQDSNLKSRDV